MQFALGQLGGDALTGGGVAGSAQDLAASLLAHHGIATRQSGQWADRIKPVGGETQSLFTELKLVAGSQDQALLQIAEMALLELDMRQWAALLQTLLGMQLA